MIDDVVAEHHVAGDVAGVFAGHLAEIGIVDQVAFHDHAGAAIAIVGVGSDLVVIDRVGRGTDVVNGVAENPAVAGLVVGGVRRNSLESDVVEADVVAVVNQIVGLHEILHVAVEGDVLAASGGVVINLISPQRDVINGCRRLCSVQGDGQRVGGVATAERLHNVVDMIVHNFNVAARALEVDSHGNFPFG